MAGLLQRPRPWVARRQAERDEAEPSSSTGSVDSQPASAAPETASSAFTPETPPSPAAADSKASEDYFAAEELVQELTDPQKFGTRGEAWFFAQLAVIALVVFPPVPLQGLIDLVGTLSLTSGVVFMVYALLSLGRSLSPLPQPRKNHSLVTTGMYGYVRHPMYGGVLLASIGLAAITHSEIRLALSGLLWYILEQKLWHEEKMLVELYPEYEEYKVKVKKFIPFVY